MTQIRNIWKGFALCLAISIPCWFLGNLFPIVGGPVFGILTGMLITLFLKDKFSLQPGITFTSKKILQYAVVLLGFGLNLSVILETGRQSLPIILSTISTSLIIAFVLHGFTFLGILHSVRQDEDLLPFVPIVSWKGSAGKGDQIEAID